MANPKSTDNGVDFEENGTADAWSAVAVIVIVVATVCFWLHGMK